MTEIPLPEEFFSLLYDLSKTPLIPSQDLQRSWSDFSAFILETASYRSLWNRNSRPSCVSDRIRLSRRWRRLWSKMTKSLAFALNPNSELFCSWPSHRPSNSFRDLPLVSRYSFVHTILESGWEGCFNLQDFLISSLSAFSCLHLSLLLSWLSLSYQTLTVPSRGQEQDDPVEPAFQSSSEFLSSSSPLSFPQKSSRPSYKAHQILHEKLLHRRKRWD